VTRKAYTLAGEMVEVRRRYFSVSIGAQDVAGMVIGNDENEIGLAASLGGYHSG